MPLEDASLGYSFQPGNEKRLRQGLNKGRLGPAADEALKVISLRLPEFLGGNPLTPGLSAAPRVGGAGPGAPPISIPGVPTVNSPIGQPPAGSTKYSGGGGSSGGGLGGVLAEGLGQPPPPVFTPGEGEGGRQLYEPPPDAGPVMQVSPMPREVYGGPGGGDGGVEALLRSLLGRGNFGSGNSVG